MRTRARYEDAPPRAFGLGVDCEDIARWRELLPALRNGSFGAAFSPEEHRYCSRFADPAASYAGRWCAKEAVVKALSKFMSLCIRDVTIGADASGAPVVRLRRPSRRGPSVVVQVSIAHSRERAVAFALAIPGSRRAPGRRPCRQGTRRSAAHEGQPSTMARASRR